MNRDLRRGQRAGQVSARFSGLSALAIAANTGRGSVGRQLLHHAATLPQQIRPIRFSQRTSTTEVQSFAKLYPSLRPGELIEGTSDPRFREAWAMAQADSFAAAE